MNQACQCAKDQKIISLQKELGQFASPEGFGKIWYIADNLDEAIAWQRDYLSKGAKSVKIEPHADGSGKCDVVTLLGRDAAVDILGTQPDDEEWLEEPSL